MRNLISEGQLDSEGHTTTFGTLYMTSSYRDMMIVVDNIEKFELWHLRLGHMSERG